MGAITREAFNLKKKLIEHFIDLLRENRVYEDKETGGDVERTDEGGG